MANLRIRSLAALQCLALLLSSATAAAAAAAAAKKTYIVHMNPHHMPSSFATHRDWYASSLQSLSSSDASEASDASAAAADPFLYTYTAAFHGFAATLDPDEADALRSSASVFGVYEDTVYELHTTRTPAFLGISDDLGLWDPQEGPNGGKRRALGDVIIGVLDTGVWPESKSFDDAGMPELPARWKGACESGPDFSAKSCNKKLIGARFFSKGSRMASGSNFLESPRDRDGHGTHTASTAAGSPVANASLHGYARGTARGMAEHARVAAYKVCWSSGCSDADILAGMDQAILDGVDVLSLSLGQEGVIAPYYLDMTAIGAFAAMERGIFVSCSAGNSGPKKESLANVAPWIMTVGAGTLDRNFQAYALLGNGKRYTGVSLYSGHGMGHNPVPVIYSKDYNISGQLCLPGSLDPALTRGKVVLCDRGVNAPVEKGQVVRDAGGVGMILANTAADGEVLKAESHLIPAVAVGRKMGDVIRKYVKSDRSPTAVLSFRGTVVNVRPSPVVAEFSSRGPNTVTQQILKPDVIGPGVNILAGWSGAAGPTGLESNTRKTLFNIVSGTSMSCPHISGVAALLKSAHPNWSPSAIKSALMTTAYNLDNTGSRLRDAASGTFSTPWAHGSGHVDPQKALSPGLVYDLKAEDYIAFLCSLDYYTINNVMAIVRRPNVTCSRKFSDPGELNYPSFSVVFNDKKVVRYTRELTNVGAAGSMYNVSVAGPSTVGVTVKPMKLIFPKVGDKMRYTVTFVSKKGTNPTTRSEFGSIVWSNAQNQVRSPVAYAWTKLVS